MSDAYSNNPGAARPNSSPGRILAIVVPVALVGLAAYWWSTTLEARARNDMASGTIGRMFIADPTPLNSAMAFPDADNDMVADPPTDAAKQVNPDALLFSYVATEGQQVSDDVWKELVAALKQKTGKEVKVVHFNTADEQMAAVKKGELQIIGLNTGLVQNAVEQFGFVPVCTLGKADGTWGYTMEFLVPAGSPIKKLEDIKRNNKVVFTTLDSNSGCKAPLVELKKRDLLPDRDYQYGFSQGHEASIKSVAAKEKGFDVVPIASDILARMEENKEVDPTTVVSIYKSERFPPATIGYVYNLTPELRDGIKETLLKFEWKGTGLEKQFGPEGKEKFVPVNYKDDWANTRRIDSVIAEARKASPPPAQTMTKKAG